MDSNLYADLYPNLEVICDFDLYGFTDDNIADIATILGQVLEVDFVHYSYVYQAWGKDDDKETAPDEFDLHLNFNPQKQKWVEQRFQEYPVIFFACADEDSYQLEARLKQTFGERIVLLERRTINIRDEKSDESL